jgi:chromate transport protein ChrA
MPLFLVSHSPNGPDFLPILVAVSAVAYVLVFKALSWRDAVNKSKRILSKLILIGLVAGVFFLAFKFVEALVG